MSSVVIAGDVSGSVTLQAPSAAGSTVLTLPATSGTVAVSAGVVTAGGVVYTDGTKEANTGAGTSGQFLQSAGSGAPVWATPAGGFSNIQVFTSSGTFTVPAGITKVKVTVVGGGAGATNYSATFGSSGGGGAGGTAIKIISGLTPGGTVSVTVGTGGAAGTGGGTSSFGAYCSATGGSTGSVGSSNNKPGVGGTGSSGDINITGGIGGASGSGSASGGCSFMGGGGCSATDSTYGATLVNGQAYGSGGGAAVSNSAGYVAGVGKAGVVIVEY